MRWNLKIVFWCITRLGSCCESSLISFVWENHGTIFMWWRWSTVCVCVNRGETRKWWELIERSEARSKVHDENSADDQQQIHSLAISYSSISSTIAAYFMSIAWRRVVFCILENFQKTWFFNSLKWKGILFICCRKDHIFFILHIILDDHFYDEEFDDCKKSDKNTCREKSTNHQNPFTISLGQIRIVTKLISLIADARDD